MGLFLYSLHVLSGFDDRVGSDVNTIHILPQGALAVITLVDGGAGEGGLGPKLAVMARLKFIRVWVRSQMARAELLKIRSKLAPFKCGFFSLTVLAP